MENIFIALRSSGPELIQLGPFSLRWYGLLIAISVLLGLNLSGELARKKGLKKSLINDLLPILVLASVIGARTYYVAFEWRNYTGKNFWSSIDFLNLNIPITDARTKIGSKSLMRLFFNPFFRANSPHKFNPNKTEIAINNPYHLNEKGPS